MADVSGGTPVVFSGGGTGGHLYPALALAGALVELRPDVRPWFVGARRGLEARVLPERDVPHTLLPVRGVARGEGLANWRVLPALVRSLLEARGVFRRLRPHLVVVTGGYAGGPAGLLAVLGGVPLALQEQNAVPGMVTRALSRWARQIHVAFPEAAAALPRRARARVVHSGNPVRPPRDVDRGRARSTFGLAPGATVVLVVGGSQGSVALNRVIVEAVREVQAGHTPRPAGLEMLWATGPAHLEGVLEALGGEAPEWVEVVDYLDEMELALAAADLAVSRAGAMATSEFLAWGLPMILVPLPTAAADHQTQNARMLEAAGAALHLPEHGLSGADLWSTLARLVGDPSRLEAQREAARARGRPDAARRIAAALADLLPPAGDVS